MNVILVVLILVEVIEYCMIRNLGDRIDDIEQIVYSATTTNNGKTKKED